MAVSLLDSNGFNKKITGTNEPPSPTISSTSCDLDETKKSDVDLSGTSTETEDEFPADIFQIFGIVIHSTYNLQQEMHKTVPFGNK